MQMRQRQQSCRAPTFLRQALTFCSGTESSYWSYGSVSDVWRLAKSLMLSTALRRPRRSLATLGFLQVKGLPQHKSLMLSMALRQPRRRLTTTLGLPQVKGLLQHCVMQYFDRRDNMSCEGHAHSRVVRVPFGRSLRIQLA